MRPVLGSAERGSPPPGRPEVRCQSYLPSPGLGWMRLAVWSPVLGREDHQR